MLNACASVSPWLPSQDKIRDLLCKDQKQRLELKERADTGVYVKDLSAFVAKSVKEIEHVMNVGNQNRTVGATDMNEHSSRSHAVFIVTVECAEVVCVVLTTRLRVWSVCWSVCAESECAALCVTSVERAGR